MRQQLHTHHLGRDVTSAVSSGRAELPQGHVVCVLHRFLGAGRHPDVGRQREVRDGFVHFLLLETSVLAEKHHEGESVEDDDGHDVVHGLSLLGARLSAA